MNTDLYIKVIAVFLVSATIGYGVDYEIQNVNNLIYLRYEAALAIVLIAMGISAYVVFSSRNATRLLEISGKMSALDRSMATVEFAMDGTILAANRNMLDIIGYTDAEAKGTHHSDLVPRAHRESPDYAEFWSTLRHGQFVSGEFHRIRRDGSDIWMQASYSPIVDKKGKPHKVIKYASDVTPAVKLRQAAERVRSVVDENIATVSASVSETHGIAEGVSKGASELNHSVTEIAKNLASSRDQIGLVADQSRSAQDAVQELEAASESMNTIVELIQGIASQITLLALNAAIEAARAGDAGRGFAVVSDEVKKLAQQTADATTEISGEIQKMQGISGRVVKSLSEIAASVTTVSDSINAVATATDQQSSVTHEIARSMSEVTTAVEAINASIIDITRITGES